MNAVERVRSSCRFVAENSELVRVDSEAIERFVAELDFAKFEQLAKPSGLPLRFDNLSQEINFHTVINLLNFGSGFRKELHRACERGAYETMLFGVMSMHIAQFEMTASNLKTISRASVTDFFRIPYTYEAEQSPGIYVSKQTSLAPLVDMIMGVLNESGKLLESYGYKDFSQFIVENSKTKSAVALTESLVKAFPAFDDKFEWKGTTIFIYKKAQLVAAELYRHLKNKDSMFDFTDMDKLTVYSDNVVPAVLRYHKILVVNEALTKKIEDGIDLSAGNEDLQLRACAIVAAEEVTTQLQRKYPEKRITELEVDYYLWVVAKEPEVCPRSASVLPHNTASIFLYYTDFDAS